MPKEMSYTVLIGSICQLLLQARSAVARNINRTMVLTYYEIGRMIVEEQQHGEKRAGYGEELLKALSRTLTKEFGKGYTVRNLELMRKFFLTYSKSKTVFSISGKSESPLQHPQKPKTVFSESANSDLHLGWSHYIQLMRIDDEDERRFYEIEAVNNNWSVRELKRQYDSALYERLVLSANKTKVKELSEKGQIIEQPQDIIKEPYILEFLGLKESATYSESELETAIISRLENFLLELGKGFTFVARQIFASKYRTILPSKKELRQLIQGN